MLTNLWKYGNVTNMVTKRLLFPVNCSLSGGQVAKLGKKSGCEGSAKWENETWILYIIWVQTRLSHLIVSVHQRSNGIQWEKWQRPKGKSGQDPASQLPRSTAPNIRMTCLADKNKSSSQKAESQQANISKNWPRNQIVRDQQTVKTTRGFCK